HPDGGQAALGLKDGTVLVRDLTTGAESARLRGHRSLVCSLAVAPGGRRLVSGDDRGTVKVWEQDPGGRWACARTVTTDPAVFPIPFALPWLALTPDGERLAALSDRGSAVSLWDLADGDRLARFRGPEGERLRCLAFHPGGALLAAGYKHRGGHGVFVWEVATGQLKHTLSAQLEEVATVGFSPDGALLACGCDEAVT